MKKTIIFVSLAFAFNNANALEVETQQGRAWAKSAPNGVWKQEGFAYTQNLVGQSGRLGVTGRPFKNFEWLRVQLDYNDFGQTNGNLQFVSDENYSSNAASPCRAPCEPPRKAEWQGWAQGLGLSLLPTLRINKKVDGYVRLGFIEYHAVTLVKAQNFHDNMVLDLNPTTGTYRMQNNGFSWYWGIGGAIAFTKSITGRVDYSVAPNVFSGKDGAFSGIPQIISFSIQGSF